jgi:hypothetical protein
VGRVNLVTGQAQTGKTTLALRLLHSADVPRVLILDPVRSRPITSEVESGRTSSFAHWTGLASFLAGAGARGPWRVALRSESEHDYARALACAPYYRHVAMLVDEGLWFCSSKPLLRPLIRAARANAHYGGGIGVPLWITAQRPMDLPPDIRSQADQFISFRQEEPADLVYLSERTTPAFAQAVAELRNHGWVSYPPLKKGEAQYGRQLEADSVRDGGSVHPAGSVPSVPGAEPEYARSRADAQSVGGNNGE